MKHHLRLGVMLMVTACAASVFAAPPARVTVRDSTAYSSCSTVPRPSPCVTTTFPATGQSYDVFNNALTQSLQQYTDDRAAYQFGERGDRPVLIYSGTLAALVAP